MVPRSLPNPYALVAGGTLVMTVVMGIGRFVFTPILPAMMEQLGLSASQAGLIASSNYFGYLLGAALAGGVWAAGRERVLVLGGLAATVVALAAMAVSDAVTSFVAIRFVAGIASAVGMIFVTTTVNQRLDELGRPDLQNVHFAGVGLGIALSSVTTGATIGDGAGWPSPWLWVALVALAASAAVPFLIDRGPAVAADASREPALPRNLPLTLMIASYGLFGLGYIVTATFLLAIVRSTGADANLETHVWLATGIAGFFSAYVWNLISSRVGATSAYVAACFLQAASVITSVAIGGTVALVVAGFLFGGTFIAMTALGLQLGRRLAPDAPRRVLAVMTTAFGIGQILGPLVAGYLADRTGSFVLPSTAAGLILVLAGLMVLIAPPKAPRLKH